jgi:hypothetical protein
MRDPPPPLLKGMRQDFGFQDIPVIVKQLAAMVIDPKDVSTTFAARLVVIWALNTNMSASPIL